MSPSRRYHFTYQDGKILTITSFCPWKRIGMNGLTHAESLRYSRHLMMSGWALRARKKKLKGRSVLLVGTGGLGSPVALYLAAAGVGRIGLVDYDVVDDSNLQRQVLHGTDRVGKLKVKSARQRLLEFNPFIRWSL